MIDKRVDEMMRQGLVYEVKSILNKIRKYFHAIQYASKNIWGVPAITGIGYKEWKSWFDLPRNASQTQKTAVLKDIVQRIKYNTHAYVRRQMTWLKRDREIKWITNVKTAYFERDEAKDLKHIRRIC